MQRSPTLLVTCIWAVHGDSGPVWLTMNQTWGSGLPRFLQEFSLIPFPPPAPGHFSLLLRRPRYCLRCLIYSRRRSSGSGK